jgi:hypothetical protein
MGVDWPGTDLSILGLIALYGAVTFGLVASLRRVRVRVGSGGQLGNAVEAP